MSWFLKLNPLSTGRVFPEGLHGGLMNIPLLKFAIDRWYYYLRLVPFREEREGVLSPQCRKHCSKLASSRNGVSIIMNTEQRLLVVVNQLIKEREALRSELKKTQDKVEKLNDELNKIYGV